jgi:hypothetical protein
MAIFQAPGVTAFGYQPPGSGHGEANIVQQLHAAAAVSSALAANDTIEFGWLPANAVVTGAVLRAAGQLETSGSPTLTFDLGVSGTAQLWKAAVTTVGRAAGASSDATIASAGGLYKNTSGARQKVIATCHAAAATPAAGTLECAIGYFVEDAPGSAA